jgi:hypothetical protein
MNYGWYANLVPMDVSSPDRHRGRVDKERMPPLTSPRGQPRISRPLERERFPVIAETELLALHEGNFARYQIRPSKFAVWQKAWNEDA